MVTMSIAATYNIVIEQYSDFSRTFQIKEGDTVKDITGYSFQGEIRERSQSTTSHDFTCSIVDATDGQWKAEMTDTLTGTIKPGDYVYDIVMTDDAGIKTRLLQGEAKVTAGVTR